MDVDRDRPKKPHGFGAERIRPIGSGAAANPKGRRRVEAILDAAGGVLAEEGHDGFSVRAVAARAGVRPGHLQYYFPAKADLVRALLERHLERAAQALHTHLGGAAETPRARLDSALDALLASQESASRCRLFHEIWALAGHDAGIAAALRAFYAGYWRTTVTLLVELNPALGRAAAERRAALIVAALEGLTLFRSRRDPARLPLLGLERELKAFALRLATDA
jgi:AcrR family transcriptional regulator